MSDHPQVRSCFVFQSRRWTRAGRKRHGRAALLLPLLSLLLALGASCADDDNPGAPDTDLPSITDEGPPQLPLPPKWSPTRFQNDASVAREARARVEAELNRTRSLTLSEESFLLSLNGIHWPPPQGNCRTVTVAGGPGRTYRACRDGLEYSLEVEWNGRNGLDGTVYDHWVRCRSHTDAQGRSGSLVIYEENTTAAQWAWDWRIGAEEASEAWNFYDGAPDPDNLAATLTRVVADDGSEEDAWTRVARSRWEAQLTREGTSGRIRFYLWIEDGELWSLTDEISWGGGHGLWRLIDGEGVIDSSRVW